MSELEVMQAEELDSYLNMRQAGLKSPRPGALPQGEIDLLEGLLALKARTRPDPIFAAELENRLMAQARRRLPHGRRSSSAPQRLWGLLSGTPHGAPTHLRPAGIYLAGALALVAVVLLALSLWPKLQPPSGAAVANEPSAVPSETAPSRPAPTPGETPSAAPPSPAAEAGEPAPTVEAPVEEPAVPLPPRPAEAPLLPRLAEQAGSGFGGGGRSGEVAPPDVSFSLNTTLPPGPDQITVYAQTPALLTLSAVEEMSTRWGVDGTVYMPLWMTTLGTPEAFERLDYAVIDDPVRLYFEGTELLRYWDWEVAPAHGGRWAPPEHLPPVAEAVATAEQFLADRGLLQPSYQIDAEAYAETGSLSFLVLVDDTWTVTTPFAQVTISPDGRIGHVTYRTSDLEPLAAYPILSAQQAWELVGTDDTDGRFWYEVEALSWAGPLRDLGAWNPRFWARQYQVGQQVDLFGPLFILYPTDPAASPHVMMNDLVLAGGDLGSLAETYQGLVEATMDAEAQVHVWGEIRDGGGYRVLQVAGWDSSAALPRVWSGTIWRQGDGGLLLADDGLIYTLPDVPADVVDGMTVFINGGQVGETLEWSIIQEQPAEMVPPRPAGAQVLAAVEQVELVYFSASSSDLSAEAYADWGRRSVQPAWRFSGHTDQGIAFAVYVQAVDETYLLSQSAAGSQQ